MANEVVRGNTVAHRGDALEMLAPGSVRGWRVVRRRWNPRPKIGSRRNHPWNLRSLFIRRPGRLSDYEIENSGTKIRERFDRCEIQSDWRELDRREWASEDEVVEGWEESVLHPPVRWGAELAMLKVVARRDRVGLIREWSKPAMTTRHIVRLMKWVDGFGDR